MPAEVCAQGIRVIALLDSEPGSRLIAANELIKTKILASKQVLFINSAFDNDADREADVEDLLDPATYDRLVAESYEAELRDIKINLNTQLPRICVRYDKAMTHASIPFHKSRPAKLFMMRLAEKRLTLSIAEEDRFRRLFQAINKALAESKKRRMPFEAV